MKIKHKLIISLLVIFTIISLAFITVFIYSDKLISEYQTRTFKYSYLSGYDISNIKFVDLNPILEKLEEQILNYEIIFFKDEKEVTFKLLDIGLIFDNDSIITKIKDKQTRTNIQDKIKLLNDKLIKDYDFLILFDEDKLNELVEQLATEFNLEMKEDQLNVDSNHSLVFEEGYNGFQINKEAMKETIQNYLQSKFKNSKLCLQDKIFYRLEIVGDQILKKENNLKSINKKVSSFSTSFQNSGNRGHNINLAASRLNKTIVNPGETFSFRKTVGPYTCQNGYKTAPVQSASGYDCGGGVCQVSSTLYNAQLLAGLKTMMRYNHGQAVAYVARGRDATVSGSSVDYRFQNQYAYPIYIISYVNGNKLIIDIWTNENALGGKTYDVMTKYLASGGYATYLLVYENNKLIETKYLHTSFYS